MHLQRILGLAAPMAALGLAAGPAAAVCPDFGLFPGTEIAELETSLGTLCLELLPEDAPITVENFKGYVERGDYDGSFVHRSIAGFVVQGGGFGLGAQNEIVPVPPQPPIQNEPCVLDATAPPPEDTVSICSERGNERGTVAMAKVANDPNSATSQWFINLADNRAGVGDLDTQNGGFTVFARVLGDGMSIVDQMAALPITAETKMYWLSPLFVRAREGLFATTPVHSDPPLLPAGSSFGCFDPTRLAIVGNSPAGAPAIPFGDPPTDFDVVSDPVTGDPFLFIGTDCATPIPPGTFQPQPSSDPSCTDPAQRALGADGILAPRTADSDMDGFVDEFSLSCLQKQEALASREIWREDFKARLASELVVIERAAIIQVPEPGAEVLGVAACGVLVALRRRRAGARGSAGAS